MPGVFVVLGPEPRVFEGAADKSQCESMISRLLIITHPYIGPEKTHPL